MEKSTSDSQSWRSMTTTSLSPSWKPISFKRLMLVCMVIATSLLLSITVILHFIDSRYGSLFVAAPGQELPVCEVFLTRYLPTVLLVTYGTWVSALDLDVKRLQPWFCLSSPPVKVEESPLLCRYDTNFVLTVLVGSFRKRHWIVFSSSILNLIATVVVPAVQSSMFTTRSQDVHKPLLLSHAANLINIDSQKFQMTSNLLLSAYSTAWLGQNAPAFSTNSYALSPFNIKDTNLGISNTPSANATIRGSTLRYRSELDCWSPASVTLNYSSNTVNFDDGRGCEAHDLLSFNASITDSYDQSATYEAYQYGVGSFGGNPYLPSLITECPNRPHLTLATWRAAGSHTPNFAQGGNATAIFCEASYFSEPVIASIKMPELSVVSYISTGPRSEVGDDLFNRTHFEYIISSGSPPLDTTYDNLTAIVDIADSMYVEQSTRILNMSVAAPTQQSKDVMIGFALGVTQLPVEMYLDINMLYTAYTQAHQLLFVHALQHVFETETSGLNASIPGSQNGTLITQRETTRLVAGFTIATEVLLGSLCMLCIYLLLSLPRRQLLLHRNPDTLAETMILSRSLATQACFSRMTLASDKILNGRLHNSEFRLEYDVDGPLLVPDLDEQDGMVQVSVSTTSDLSNHEAQRTKHSLEFSWTVSGLICGLLLTSAASIIALQIVVWKRDGLGIFPSSEIVQQLSLNLLPTAAATLLGIYLVLLCRVYSFMKPMQDLYHGNATAKTTLMVNYTSTPPQLLFGRAIRSRHYLLAALSIAALLSNVLTVTTASMFTLQQGEADASIKLFSNFEPVVIDHTSPSVAAIGDATSSSPMDSIYPNAVNMSDGVQLPSWTSTEYGFLPINFQPAAQFDASSYGLELLGYGADLECSNLLESKPQYSGSIEFQNNGTTFKVWANFSEPDSGPTACVFDLEYENELARLNLAKLSSTVSALEIANYMKRWNGSLPLQDGYCASRIIKGWLRARTITSTTQQNNFNMDYNATIIICQPRLKSQLFGLNVTANGDILSSQAVAAASYDVPPSVNLSSTFRVAINAMRDFINLPQWHNDTIARDWSNYLFLEYNGNRDWLNASMPPPTVEEASSVVNAIFKRIFAVQLSLDRVRLQRINSTDSSATLRMRAEDQNTTASNSVAVKVHIPAQKLFVSRPNFIISLMIIIFDLIVLVIFRLTLPKPFLPRMPFTIASQIAFFSGSHVIDDVVKAGGDLKKLDEQGYRYAYGRYIGKDGWLHTGIERQQFVTKL